MGSGLQENEKDSVGDYCGRCACISVWSKLMLQATQMKRKSDKAGGSYLKGDLLKITREMQCPTGDVFGQGATHRNNYREKFSDVGGDIGTKRPGRVGLCMIITSVAVGMTGVHRVEGEPCNSIRESARGGMAHCGKRARSKQDWISLSLGGWEMRK